MTKKQKGKASRAKKYDPKLTLKEGVNLEDLLKLSLQEPEKEPVKNKKK